MNEKQIRTLLDEYRRVSDTLLTIVTNALPPQINRVVTTSEKFTFVNSIKNRRQINRINLGEWHENHYMCEEFFYFAGGKLPVKYKNRPFSQFSLDLVLNVEESPFAMIAFDEKTKNYALKKARKSSKFGEGYIITNDRTCYVMYTAKEIVKRVEFASIQVAPDGKTIFTVKRKDSPSNN
ncbi:MAG: hypothetical protein Q7R87_00400 [Nanoarchaeota archaeon]|nr:hypothetical protein [Nanoarchaeota archaeon]